MLPIFIVCLTLFSGARSRGALLSLAVVFLGVYVLYNAVGSYEDVMAYYVGTSHESFERLEKHGLQSLVSTFSRNGIWGTGLGSAATGVHHLGVSTNNWQEGGLGRIAVELGLPGLLLFFYGGALLMWEIYRNATFSRQTQSIGLAAIVFGNLATFVVSGQIFGAPFIGFWMSVILGMALARVRADVPAGDMSATKQSLLMARPKVILRSRSLPVE